MRSFSSVDENTPIESLLPHSNVILYFREGALKTFIYGDVSPKSLHSPENLGKKSEESPLFLLHFPAI